ncbi:MAG: glycosyltransferase family 8 protein [Prevotella sp.]|nr:glycosyltransferase family 8 protein [Prevotella sp.]
MNIVCATDNNFVQHCCVMLVSVLMNNEDVTVYLLTEGLTPDNERIISEEVTARGGKVHFCIVDPTVIDRFPMPAGAELAHISRATYYRLLIPELLPREVGKVLYLDCDIVVNHSIADLWNIDLTGYALAAVPSVGFGKEAVRLGYPMEYGYFNAGVTLINVDYFRQYDVSRKLMEYIASNYDHIKFHDQDTLNAVLYDQYLHLEAQWNMTPNVYDSDYPQHGDRVDGRMVNDYAADKRNALAHKADPTIVHFASHPKPWQRNCVHPLYHLYYDYAGQTLHFSNLRPQSILTRGWAIVIYRVRKLASKIKHRVF